MRDRPPAHEERDVAPRGLLLGEDAHRRDARATRNEEEIARRAPDHKRGAERPQQIEEVAGMT
jgi:hypothetical protein